MTRYKTLHIIYSNPDNLNDELKISYRLRSTPIVQKWTERVIAAQKLGYKIDDPARFYGFGTIEQQTNKALNDINSLISNLNNWIPINYSLHSVNDQDTLNQLHHIFEVEHGLLDNKKSDTVFQQSLCNLNLLVHRCESIARGAYPRHVVTYFGLPKTKILCDDDYNYFDSQVCFGTVYINYAEIGKTLYDLMMDNDSYIDSTAFQPFRHYSADFVVRFWNDNTNPYDQLYTFYSKHTDFFTSLGYSWDALSRSIGSIPVADLEYDGDILKMLETRQFVKAVHFS
jgi:hypothetical protein